jgi:hypothetical protein
MFTAETPRSPRKLGKGADDLCALGDLGVSAVNKALQPNAR